MRIGHRLKCAPKLIWIDALERATCQLDVLWLERPTPLRNLRLVGVVLGARQTPNVVNVGGAVVTSTFPMQELGNLLCDANRKRPGEDVVVLPVDKRDPAGGYL